MHLCMVPFHWRGRRGSPLAHVLYFHHHISVSLSQVPILQPNHTYCLEFPQTELRTMSHLRGLQWSSLSVRADGLVSSVYIYSLICLYHCVLTAFISETCHFVIPYPASFPGPSSNVSNGLGNEAITYQT